MSELERLVAALHRGEIESQCKHAFLLAILELDERLRKLEAANGALPRQLVDEINARLAPLIERLKRIEGMTQYPPWMLQSGDAGMDYIDTRCGRCKELYFGPDGELCNSCKAAVACTPSDPLYGASPTEILGPNWNKPYPMQEEAR